MAKVIHFEEAAERRKNNDEKDLSTYLRKAILLRNEIPENRGVIQIASLKKMKMFFEGKISEILINHQFIDTEFFLCGNYISELLTSIANQVPESWFAVDYILKSNESDSPLFLKQGANICFLICSVFKERSEIRAMRYEDYEKMGIGLFNRFYSQTGAEIGYHMSRQYKIMVNVTDECLKAI